MKTARKLILICVIAFLTTLAISTTASAKTEVTVTLPTFDVIINGQEIPSYYEEDLQYPFYVYKGITYFPMTYYDCSTLGIYNYWTAETGNVITSGRPCAEYTEVFSGNVTYGKNTAKAYIADTKITVNGKVINNSTEEYPILNCNNMLYFPMTWRWTSEFGWLNSFANNTLSIYTADCPYKNLVYGYDYEDMSRKYMSLQSYYNGDYIGLSFRSFYLEPEGYTQLYGNVTYKTGKPGTQRVCVAPNMVNLYLSNGWKTFYDYWNSSTHYLWYIANRKYYDGISFYESYADEASEQPSAYLCYLLLQNRMKLIGEAGYKDYNSPLVCDDYWLYDDDNNDKNDTVRLYFANLSGKEISAMELSWDCYDLFGDPIVQTFYNDQGILVTKQGSETFKAYGDDLDFEAYSTTWIEWDVSKYSLIKEIRNIKIKTVVFSDGTTWKA